MPNKLFGKSLVTEVVGPEQLRGQFISLNMKQCKWFLPPSQDPRLQLTVDDPTTQIPETATVEDLECILLKLRGKHLVIGRKPVEEFTKNPDRLEEHLSMIQGSFPTPVVKDHITSIVNGVNLDGGYNKIEILESMLEAEEVNPLTGSGGRNRKAIVEYLREAIEYVEEIYGGVSKVKREEFRPAKDGASLREVTPAKIDGSKARNFLGLNS